MTHYLRKVKFIKKSINHNNGRRKFFMPKKEDQRQTTSTPSHPGRPKRNMAAESVVKPKNTKGTLVRLWGYLRSQKLSLIFVTLFTAFSAVLMLMGPYLIGVAVDKYIIPRDYNGLIFLCLVLLSVYVGSSVFSWLQMHVMAVVSQHTVRDMRADLFRKIRSEERRVGKEW